MLIKLAVWVCGGMWSVRSRCRRAGPLRRFWLLLFRNYLSDKGSWISENAHFESVPCLPHGPCGIFISGGVSIGRDCVIFQQVTIGSNTLVDSRTVGAPQIGDRCYIGAGAKVIGNLKVGHNVRIGANAVVVHDVPDNSVVVPGSQELRTKDHPPDNRFYHCYKGQWRYFEDGQWRVLQDQRQLELLASRFERPNH
jgi:serine O-acetyltransferase